MTHLWSLYQRAIIKQGKQLKCHTGQHTILCESKINQSINQSYNKGRCSPGWWMGCSSDQYWPGISTKNTWCKCGPCQHTIIHKAYIGGDFHTNIINTDVVQASECDACSTSIGQVLPYKISDIYMVQADKEHACGVSIGRDIHTKYNRCRYGPGWWMWCL